MLVRVTSLPGFPWCVVFSAKTIKVLGRLGYLVTLIHLNWKFTIHSPGSGWPVWGHSTNCTWLYLISYSWLVMVGLLFQFIFFPHGLELMLISFSKPLSCPSLLLTSSDSGKYHFLIKVNMRPFNLVPL